VASSEIRQTIVVDTDTRATRQEYGQLRREIKREADGMAGDWEAAAAKIESSLRDAGARDDLIDAARRIGTQGPTEIEKMQRALRELDDTARDVAGDVKRAFGDNSLSGNDLFDANFKAEVQASARETGGEILGQISSGLADGTLDTAGLAQALSEGAVEIGAEIGGGIGGAIAAGGLIASAIIGQVNATKEAVQQTVSDLFDSILEQGSAAAVQGQILANIRELTEDQAKLNYSTELAKTLNADLGTVLRARAGDEAALAEVTAAYDAAQRSNTEAMEEGSIAATDGAKANEDLRNALEDVTNDYDTERQGIDAAKAATDAYTEATNATAEAQLVAASRLAASSGQAQTFTAVIDGATRSLQVMPDGKVIDVTDQGSVQLTQEAINGITGKEVPLTATMALSQAQGVVDSIARMLRPPTVTVRYSTGQKAV
jgi:hypothetical protein